MGNKLVKMRADEEACKRAFNDFVVSRDARMQVSWEPGSQPPDYFLLLGEVKLGVEVTTLLEIRQLGAKRYSLLGLRQALCDFVEEVEQQSQESDVLCGSYIVYVSRPISDFDKVRNDLKRDLLRYIAETQGLLDAPERTIYRAGYTRLAITKYGGREAQLGVGGPQSTKWEEEAAAEVCELLNNVLARKREKLARVPFPVVLLIRNAYHFADATMFRACVPNLGSLDAFHSVFIVSGDSCVALSTKEPTWQ